MAESCILSTSCTGGGNGSDLFVVDDNKQDYKLHTCRGTNIYQKHRDKIYLFLIFVHNLQLVRTISLSLLA
jgi:hypothetical protein